MHIYDGDSKNKTKNCNECNFYLTIKEAELCGWGNHFQYVIPNQNPSKCQLIGKENKKNSYTKIKNNHKYREDNGNLLYYFVFTHNLQNFGFK